MNDSAYNKKAYALASGILNAIEVGPYNNDKIVSKLYQLIGFLAARVDSDDIEEIDKQFKEPSKPANPTTMYVDPSAPRTPTGLKLEAAASAASPDQEPF